MVSVQRHCRAQAAAVLASLESRTDRLMQAWLLLAGLAAAARLGLSPLQGDLGAGGLLPYLLLVLAPFASMVLALRWFAGGDRLPQPRTRLARIGRWRPLPLSGARAHALYGAGGLMVSLLVGILLNVPVRAAEFLAAMPPLAGAVPEWLSRLQLLMTLDVVILTSLYSVAFVAGLRRVPLFPRLLVAIWCLDIAMQLVIADVVAATPGLPTAVGSALHALLDGNIKKVLISAALWLPYLLLSARVNVTYRHRIAL